MNCLVVQAHPLQNSLCSYLSEKTIEHLTTKGYTVTVKNLYEEEFNPVLSKAERESYYSDFDKSDLSADINQLMRTESLVLIFPTWWFSFPAILKGWFDRVWAPGSAYDHASDLGLLQPKLNNLKEMKVVTTLGSSWWIDYLVLRRPVRKVLKFALLGACSRKSSFKMLTLYKSENISTSKLDQFVSQIKSSF